MSHTQGKLTINKDFPDRAMGSGSNGFGTIARALLGCCSKAEQEANAHRLVACWNACDGLSTQELEMSNADFVEALKERIELKFQRDELQSCLSALIEHTHEICENSYGHEVEQAYINGREAIAKASL